MSNASADARGVLCTAWAVALVALLAATGSAMARNTAMSTPAEEVDGAYLAYYARSADPAGKDYWTDRLVATGGDLSALIAAFANSPEAAERYGGKSNEEILAMLYHQLFNRDPDPAGQRFYLDALDSGRLSLASIALDVLYGAQGEDLAILANKLEVSRYFTEQILLTGTPFDSSTVQDNISLLSLVSGDAGSVPLGREATDVYMLAYGDEPVSFARIATFPVFLNLAADEDTASETASEIIAAAHDGTVLVYTDSPMERIGFIDIVDSGNPQPAGFFALDGEPTSVAVVDDYALVGINTSESFVSPSGYLAVIDIADIAAPAVVAEIDLGGQPDSVAVSPDGRFAAIAIENERDEDACADGDGGLIGDAYGDEDACETAGGIFGGLPQLPAGYLSIVALEGAPGGWSAQQVNLTGLAVESPSDPEPEFVAINGDNQAAVSLQENNHLVVVDLEQRSVSNHFSAGATSLTSIDALENDVIDLIYDLDDLVREPDALTWLFDDLIVTANEGDWKGGSRGVTTFLLDGGVLLDSAEEGEYRGVEIGHYPEFRAENKGVEPEGVLAARYGPETYVFTGAERANVVFVARADEADSVQFQDLPTGVAPEGLLAIPLRGLFVIAAEEDSADDGIRSLVSIFKLAAQPPEYPQIRSEGSPPIGWGALSALAADPADAGTLYTAHDSFYAQSRVYTVDVSATPAVITAETQLTSGGDPVDYDLEGLARRATGGFWAVSEGNAADRPNLLLEIADDGTVVQEIGLEPALVANRVRFGLEGVTVTGSGADETVYLAFQREWADDPEGYVKIASYTPATESWDYVYYPLDAAPDGAWVGLSEIVTLDESGRFAVIERDNQQGPAATVKRVYEIDLSMTMDEGFAYPVVNKTLLRDLLPDYQAGNGWVPDKVEGMAVGADDQVYVVTDNDGIDDAVGETWFLRLGTVDEAFAQP